METVRNGNMEIKVTSLEEQQISRWSGGSTTQLAIFPEGASYLERSFAWRISTAVIESETSEFTMLPGFYRHLMILKGDVHIEHEGFHQCRLKDFEVDTFDGAWKTASRGAAVDFNLMLAAGWKGSLDSVILGEGQEVLLKDTDGNNTGEYKYYGIYCYEGAVSIDVRNQGRSLGEKFQMKTRDFALVSIKGIDGEMPSEILYKAKSNASVVFAKVEMI